MYVTSSYFGNEGGGTWWDYDNLECTQSFIFQSSDIYMDVSSIVKKSVNNYKDIDVTIYNKSIKNLETVLESKKRIINTIISENKFFIKYLFADVITQPIFIG